MLKKIFFTHSINQRIYRVATVLLSSLLLYACAAAVVGTGIGAGLVSSDRRSSGAQLDDEGIETRLNARIRGNIPEARPHHVNVTSFNRRVLLTGEVATEEDKILIQKLGEQVDNVKLVINELAVMYPSGGATRTSDGYITTRIKTRMMDAQKLSASTVKVVTERGIVYLMGRLTAAEAEIATEIASRSDGVVKVVRSFEIITEQELKRIMSL